MSLGTFLSRYSPQDLDAVYEYVRNQRPSVEKYPKLLPLISAFESWFQGIGWYARYVDTDETMQEARRRRDEINDVMNEHLPDTWVPADSPQTVPDRLPSPLIPPGIKAAAIVGSVVAGVILLMPTIKKYVPFA